jgi:ribose transport system permease protein
MNRQLRRNRPAVLAYLVCGVLCVVCALFVQGFAAGSHVQILAIQAAPIGIIGIGQTFVILCGAVDLSVPYVLTDSAIVTCGLAHGHNGGLIWIIPFVLALAAVVGIANGVGVAFFKVSPIVMTFATNSILQGVAILYTGGAGSAAAPPSIVTSVGVGKLGPVPYAAIMWIVLGACAMWVLSKTVYGRALYATGTNSQVATFSGIRPQRVVVAAYAVSAVTAAIAGLVVSGYLGQAAVGMGDPYLFVSIAAVAVGGTSVLGGNGHYAGTVAGAVILTIIIAVLPVLGAGPAVLDVIYGAVILIAISVATVQRRGSPRTAKATPPQTVDTAADP